MIFRIHVSLPPPLLHDCLEFPRVSKRVLDGHLTKFLFATTVDRIAILLWEVDSAVLDHPSSALCKGHHGTFAIKEEEVLGRRDWKGRVGTLAT